MLKHDDIDTPISNLTELLLMINHRSDDMYISAMRQYIVNPLAWLHAEKIRRSADTMEKTGTSANKQSAPCCSYCGGKLNRVTGSCKNCGSGMS